MKYPQERTYFTLQPRQIFHILNFFIIERLIRQLIIHVLSFCLFTEDEYVLVQHPIKVQNGQNPNIGHSTHDINIFYSECLFSNRLAVRKYFPKGIIYNGILQISGQSSKAKMQLNQISNNNTQPKHPLYQFLQQSSFQNPSEHLGNISSQSLAKQQELHCSVFLFSPNQPKIKRVRRQKEI